MSIYELNSNNWIQDMSLSNDIKGIDPIMNKGLEWINVDQPTREKLDSLSKKFPLHELNIEDCLSKNQLPKIDRYDDHVFIILQFPTIKKEKTIPRFSQLSLFIGKDFLISIHQGNLRPLTELFFACKFQNLKNIQAIMGNSPGYLLHSILDALVDDLLHILMKVIGNLDDIEDAVFDDKVAIAKDISILRREITTLRRIVVPLKRIMTEVTSRDVRKFSTDVEEEDLISYFNDINDHVSKVLEALDESKETIEIYKDTDHMLSSEKTNKILSFLTILFTLSIPVSIIGTFYGMNILIPGSVNFSENIFDYFPFIITTGLSVGALIVMLYYFRKLGWLNNLTK